VRSTADAALSNVLSFLDRLRQLAACLIMHSLSLPKNSLPVVNSSTCDRLRHDEEGGAGRGQGVANFIAGK
jgi:hypothetical protein